MIRRRTEENVTLMRALRACSARSAAEVARELGWHQITISEIERNVRAASLKQQRQLSAWYGLPYDLLASEVSPVQLCDHVRAVYAAKAAA